MSFCNRLENELVVHLRANGDHPFEGQLRQRIGDRSATITGKAPCEGVLQNSVQAFGFQRPIVGDPACSVADVLHERPHARPQTSVSLTRRLPMIAVISISPPSASTYRRRLETR